MQQRNWLHNIAWQTYFTALENSTIFIYYIIRNRLKSYVLAFYKNTLAWYVVHYNRYQQLQFRSRFVLASFTSSFSLSNFSCKTKTISLLDCENAHEKDNTNKIKQIVLFNDSIIFSFLLLQKYIVVSLFQKFIYPTTSEKLTFLKRWGYLVIHQYITKQSVIK